MTLQASIYAHLNKTLSNHPEHHIESASFLIEGLIGRLAHHADMPMPEQVGDSILSTEELINEQAAKLVGTPKEYRKSDANGPEWEGNEKGLFTETMTPEYRLAENGQIENDINNHAPNLLTTWQANFTYNNEESASSKSKMPE